MLIHQPKMLIKCGLHNMSMLYMSKCAQNADFSTISIFIKLLMAQSTKAAGSYHFKVLEIVWDLNSRKVARAGLGGGGVCLTLLPHMDITLGLVLGELRVIEVANSCVYPPTGA